LKLSSLQETLTVTGVAPVVSATTTQISTTYTMEWTQTRPFGGIRTLTTSTRLQASVRRARSLKKDFINPTRGRFSGAVVVYGNGVKTIYVSGHTGRGEDLKAQALAAYQGVARELAAAGATPEDVVKLNTYIDRREGRAALLRRRVGPPRLDRRANGQAGPELR
jgi:enamine deaminase RidA (YjgF/YER057c/UK114 family)